MKHRTVKFLIGGAAVFAVSLGYWIFTHDTGVSTSAPVAVLNAPHAKNLPTGDVLIHREATQESHARLGAQAKTEVAKSNPSSTRQPATALISSPTAAQPAAETTSDGTGVSKTQEEGGEPANAAVRVGDAKYNLEPNAWGLFPRVLVPAEGTVRVTVAYPSGQPQDPVVIQAEDGGAIDKEKTVQTVTLNESKSLTFDFKTDQQDGVYRVTIRKGLDQKRLEFWVGQEPALQPVAASH